MCQPVAFPLERYAPDTLIDETRRADDRLRFGRPGISDEVPDDPRLPRAIPVQEQRLSQWVVFGLHCRAGCRARQSAGAADHQGNCVTDPRQRNEAKRGFIRRHLRGKALGIPVKRVRIGSQPGKNPCKGPGHIATLQEVKSYRCVGAIQLRPVVNAACKQAAELLQRYHGPRVVHRDNRNQRIQGDHILIDLLIGLPPSKRQIHIARDKPGQ